MTRKLAGFTLIAILATLTALAQAGAPASAPPATSAAAPASTTAPAAPATRVGIINIQQAIVATNEGQRDFQALQKKFEPTQTELQASNKEIDDLKKQLSTQGDKLNEDARANLAKSVEQKQKVFQRKYEDAQADYQSQQNEIANRIGSKLLEVMDKYAKENGYAVILDVSTPQSPVLWASQTTDVTRAIVDAYNAQSGVAAPPPSPKPAAGAVKPAAPAARPAVAAPKPAPAPAKKP